MSDSDFTNDTGPIVWGDVSALFDELKVLSRSLLRHEAKAGSVKTTGLVLSALRRQKAGREYEELTWQNRAQFFAHARVAMSRALVDYARRRAARNTVGGLSPEELAACVDRGSLPFSRMGDASSAALEALSLALGELASVHPAIADTVQQYYFHELTIEQTAALLDVNEKTIRRRLQDGRVLLGELIRKHLC